MGSSQLYSLSWGEFGTSLVSAVQLLRCHGDLVDVTLAAGGRSFPAHKIVLSAASPFLLDLLKSTPCQHPVVMLAGVTAHDLEALLEFVYRGEVSVDPNQLPSLLQAAHCLNIQGLAPGTLNAETMYSLHKLDDMHPSASHEALSRDVINSFLPIRRKRKTKRRESTGNASSTGSSGSKWARHDSLSADSENQPANHHQNSSHSSHIPESDVLSNPDTRKNDDGESSNQSADETGVSPASGSGGTKIRGASDQPGACPLCGALLRQARNLRRHLLTSCKYRMSVGPGGGPGVGVGVGAAYSQQPSALEPEVQLQQPATFASLLPVALPQPGRPSSPLRPLSLQGQHHHPHQQQQQQQQQPPPPQQQQQQQQQQEQQQQQSSHQHHHQQQQSTSQSQAQEDTPMRTVLLHVQHSHQSSQQLLPLPPEERSVQLPLPVPLLPPLHHHHSPQQRRQETTCEQIVCKVSPVPSPSPGPSAPCADLVSPAAVECRRVAGTPPVAQQSQQ